jgi:hypothetical protein
MGFLFDEFFGISDRGANVVSSQLVLATDLLKRHPASQAAENARHRQAGAANHRLAVLDFRIDDNSFIHIACPPSIPTATQCRIQARPNFELAVCYAVRYDAVNAMLLNEFLKEHKKVEQLETIATEQQKEIKALTASVKAQAALIQKVSDNVELKQPAPQVADNN